MVAVLAVGTLVTVLGLYLGHRLGRVPPPFFRGDCTVNADGRVSLDAKQMANAATITAVGVRLGMPEQAVVVALATAFQESKLRNLSHLGPRNDHDSVGLFQQRPSQGWGSPEQILDPRYAAERFYQALGEVEGWEEMRVTDAAQQVQRSAFPEAYQKWSEDATVLATALLGQAQGAVSCLVPASPLGRGDATAKALGAELTQDWGEQAAVAPLTSTRIRVAADDMRTGWQYAHWLVAHAAEHGVARVRFADLEWTAARGTWSPTTSPNAHVHAKLAET